MKKTILIACGMLISFQVVFSQQTLDFIKMMNEVDKRSIIQNEGSNAYTGSPYLNDEFEMGRAVTHANVVYENVRLNLNVFNNEIHYVDVDGKTFAIPNPDYFDYVIIGDTKIKYLPYLLNKKTDKGFFKIVDEGKATLLLKPRINFEEATEPGAYSEAKPANFKRMSDQIYIMNNNSPALEITGKKDLLEVFSDQSNAIDAFIREKKIKVSKPEDIQKVVSFYNEN